MYWVNSHLIGGLITIVVFFLNGNNNQCEAKKSLTKESSRNHCTTESIAYELYRSCANKRAASDKTLLRTQRVDTSGSESELNSEEMDAAYTDILGFTPNNYKFQEPQNHGGRRQIAPHRFHLQPNQHQYPSGRRDRKDRPSIMFPGLAALQPDIPEYMFDPLQPNIDTNKKRMLRHAISNLVQTCCYEKCNPEHFRSYCRDIYPSAYRN